MGGDDGNVVTIGQASHTHACASVCVRLHAPERMYSMLLYYHINIIDICIYVYIYLSVD